MPRVRITSGAFGGRFIVAPEGRKTHPMGDRVKMALFNSIADKIADARVLDTFAGTGALGLEALSRGAREVVFIERDRTAQRIIEQNIESLGVSDRAKLVKASVASWMTTNPIEDDSEENAAGNNNRVKNGMKIDRSVNKFDLIFIDPPYKNPQFSTGFSLKKYLKPKGLMILSYPGREQVRTVNGVVVVDNRSYGEAALAIFRLDN